MKQNVCVVIADAARARLYLTEPKRGQAGKPTVGLVERLDLVQLGRRQKDSEVFRNSRPGSRLATPSGPGHAVDDRRDGHREEDDRKFAADIAREAQNVAGDAGCRDIVVAAPARMLGFFRENQPSLENAGFRVELLERELTKLTAAQLGDHPALRAALS